ncbi:tetratricopeptide repeat protein [Paludibacterium denitrificans]|uniref:tetratricopeptide repeat protein n=1 Tax=Paludibacterium denitrificans TaxID=2675226 RepID=UPI001E3C9C0E|nr:tetratricopeptide repeat protein [Paludibacterium denitrificans]
MAYPRLLVSSRQFEQSRIEFEKLLKDNPTNPDLLYGAGLLAFQFRDFAVAQRDLVAALNQHHPEADFIRFTLGQIAEEQGDTSQALNWYEMVGAGQQFLAAQARIALIDAEASRIRRWRGWQRWAARKTRRFSWCCCNRRLPAAASSTGLRTVAQGRAAASQIS